MMLSRPPLLRAVFAAACAVASVACGGATHDAPAVDADAGTGTRPILPDTPGPDGGVDPGASYPAPHPPLPQIRTTGGPVLAHPRIVAIFYASDGMREQLADYAKKMVGSAYWTSTTAEYGVGALAGADVVVLDEAPPASVDDSGITQWLAQMLDGSHPELGVADPNAVYTLFYDGDTQMDGACDYFGGYHAQAAVGSTTVAYAVIPRCPGGIATTAYSASHEWIEAATDPFPLDAARGVFLPDDDHLAWTTFPGSEIGDLCDLDTSSYAAAPELPLPAQSAWSNVAAAAGHDPCVPTRSRDPYFNASPVLPDLVPIAFDWDFGKGMSATTRGVKVPVGESRTIEVDLFSDAPTSGAWSVQAYETGSLLGGTSGGDALDFAFDRASGRNGDKLRLTITARGRAPGGGTTFMLVSTLGRSRHAWIGYVAN